MKISFSVLLFSLVLSVCTQAQNLRTPQPSPTQVVKQNFGLSDVELSYSRPSIKGRKIFGDLVPYNKVWRTGANQATTITFGDDVMIGDKKVPAGKYGLLTIPGENEWTIIVTKQLDVTSPAAYKQDQDVARVTAQVQQLPFDVETFLISFDDVKASSMNLAFLWERAAVIVPVKSDVDSKIMAQIDDVMKQDNRPYFDAALYYINSGKDLNKAVQWLDKAIQQQPNAFWAYHQKANALAKLGKKQEAIATAQKSIEIAKQAKNDDYVALNEKLIASLK